MEQGALSRLDSAILDPLEELFDAVGMMQGDSAPLKRAGVGAAVGYGIAYGMKPPFAFDPVTGKPRPWKVTAPSTEQEQATWFPAWAIVALPAFIFGAMV